MPVFMDIHDGFVGVTQEQFDEAHQRDLELQEAEGVSYDRAWLDPESGKVFCLVSGPDIDAVKRVHAQAGHPTDQVFEVTIEAR